MANTITQFANASSATGQQLDNNFKAFGALAPIPCSVAGTNALTLTQQTSGSGALSTSIAITAYANYMSFCGIAAQSNTAAATAQIGSLAALPIYKDTPNGTLALAGGEIAQGCAITLVYDSDLNAGNGGFHLLSNFETEGATINPAFVRPSVGVQIAGTTQPTLTHIANVNATLAFTSIVPNSTQEQTFVAQNVSLTDRLAWAFPQPVSTGLMLAGYAIAGNATVSTLGVRMANVSAASTITPGTITVGVAGFRLA